MRIPLLGAALLLAALLAHADGAPEPTDAAQWLAQAQAQRRAGQPLAAWQSAGQAVALQQARWGEDDLRTLDTLGEWLGLCAAAQQAATCEPRAAAALPRYEAQWRRDPAVAPGLAAFLRSRASVLNQLARFDESLAQLRLAAELLRPLGEPQAERLHAVLFGQGVVLQNLGRPAESLAVLDELLPLQTARLGPQADPVLSTAGRRASALQELGRSREAAEQLAGIVQQRAATLGPGHPQTLDSQAQLASARIGAGQAVQAVQDLLPAIAAGGRQLGATHSLVLGLRTYLVSAYYDAGLPEACVDEARRLVPDALQTYGVDHPDYGTALGELANCQWRAGDAAGAAASYAESLAAMQRAHPEGHPKRLALQINAALAAADAGQMPALPGLRALHDRAAEEFGPAHPGTLTAQGLLVRGLLAAGDVDEGLRELQALAAARVAALGPEHPTTLTTHLMQAGALARAGRDAQALAGFDAALPALQAHRRRLALLGPRAQRLIGAQAAPDLAEYVVLLARVGRLDDAWQALELHKARTLRDQLVEQRALEAVALPDAERAALQTQAREIAALEARVAALAPGPGRDAVQQQLVTLRARYAAALDQAQATHPRLARLLGVDSAAAPDANRLLRPGAALVHFLQAHDERWFAMLAAPGRAPRWFALGALPGLAGRAEALRERASGAATPDELPDAAALGAALLAPLTPALHGVRDLLIAPDGALALLPWDVLRVQGRPALQRWRISQTPSLTVLARSARPAGTARPPRGLLALAASAVVDADGQAWPPLPFARHEAEAAAALFSRQRSRVLVDAQASEAALRELVARGELAEYGTLLIAAHGRFDAREPARNAIVLASRPPRDGEPAEAVDGYVGIADWLGLPLRSDLLVLSACDSARGPWAPGEGLFGFAHALQLAGNRNLLATLWPVGDASAAAFVLDFLARVRAGEPHAHALAATKRAFVRHANPALRAPRTWAAFTLVGA